MSQSGWRIIESLVAIEVRFHLVRLILYVANSVAAVHDSRNLTLFAKASICYTCSDTRYPSLPCWHAATPPPTATMMKRHHSIRETACGGLQVGRVATYHLMEAMWEVGTVKLGFFFFFFFLASIYVHLRVQNPT